jgi:hypothetical protein
MPENEKRFSALVPTGYVTPSQTSLVNVRIFLGKSHACHRLALQ